MPVVRGVFMAVFFLSGAAALIFQIIWQRLMTLVLGSDMESVALTVSACLAGLAIGNLIGGLLADRLSLRGRIAAFAACESGVALFAVLCTIAFHNIDLSLASAWPRAGVIGTVVAFTLCPTILIGISLPVAARLLTSDGREPARWVPLLYACNTIGAGAGSLGAALFVFRIVGFGNGLIVGAVLNLLCGVTVLAVGPMLNQRARIVGTDQAPSSAASTGARLTSTAWIGFYALAGFVALGLEIVWFRVLGVMFKSSAVTLGCLLAVYLMGIGTGVLLSVAVRRRIAHPERAFLWMQAAVPAVAALLLTVVIAALRDLPAFEALRENLRGFEAYLRFSQPLELMAYAVFPIAAIVGVPTVLMGASFGALLNAAQAGQAVVGRRTGTLLAANTVGAIAGALFTWRVLLDRLGAAGSVKMLALVAFVFLWAIVRLDPAQWRRPAAGALAAAVVIVASPSGPGLWATLHGATAANVIVGEDHTGVSVVVMRRGGAHLFTNGIGQSTLPYGGIHTVLGMLPALLHPHPRRAVVIGLGLGDTSLAVGVCPGIERIDVAEIVAPQLAMLRRLAQIQPDAGLEQWLRDPRMHVSVTDGRAFLQQSLDRYDIIEADALRPTSPGAGNLYSLEYFELLKNRLAPGGLAVSWAPTERVRDTMLRVFPYVLAFDAIAVGSSSPIAFDRDALVASLRAPITRQYFASAGVDIDAIVNGELLAHATSYGPDFDRSVLPDINTDLFPLDEFRPRFADPSVKRD